MKAERIFLETFHGYNGKDQDLGKACGNTTEYDQEATICAFIQLELLDENKRCEYLPKTKRQWERPSLWKFDLHLILKCSFLNQKTFLIGAYDTAISNAFPRIEWKPSKEKSSILTLDLGKIKSLDNVQVTAREISRSLLFLL